MICWFASTRAERLLASPEDDADIEYAWAEEIRRRLDDIRTGAVELISGQEVFADLRSRFGGP